jgi:PAS domain S-box-containing protein
VLAQPEMSMIDIRSILRIIPQPASRHNTVWRYSGAVLVTLGFIAARWLLGHAIDDGVPFATLFIPIALSAFHGGLGPGIVSVLVTMVLTDYLLIPPVYTLGFPDTKALVATLMFAISGLLISALGEASRNAVFQASSEAEVSRTVRQQLLANEERLRIIERVVAGGVWEWDIVKDNVYWSDGYRRLYDYPLDETPSREKWEMSLLPEDRDRIVGQLEELLREKLHNWSVEHRARTASGRIRWIATQGQVFYDSSGKPKRMVGMNLDITARRLAQDASRENEARAHLA